MAETPEETIKRILTVFAGGCGNAGPAIMLNPSERANVASCEECLNGAVEATMAQVVRRQGERQ